ncbi:facilitated trehalose transporter Tret1-like isoform X1 [Pieris rapae]|uniref:facilitated trehalose transporter Tret1-like isoform X1 n=1 Tax=Pieris rapae TaxID=64459 RepID=UPI001E27EEA4|nr:facilitated trehalose transporter Tret1-like isoform X1 [Pieris rapae]
MSGKVKTSALLVQTLATFSIAYLTGLTGFIYAWPSYTYETFTTNKTVLSAPLTPTQMSLLGSLTNIGGLIGTPLCALVIDRIGRRYSAMLFGLPYVICWAIISMTTSINLVMFAIGFAGLGAGGQAISTVYISEISEDSIRGALTSSTVSAYFIGLLLSYLLGGQLAYHHVLYVHLAMSVLYILLLMLLKESPVFLIQQGKEKEATESIAFYRRVGVDSKEVELEINKIKMQLDPRFDLMLQSNEDANAVKHLLEKPMENAKKEPSWKFLMKSESSKGALFAVLFLMGINILMGSIVLQVYAEPLFKEAVPTMHPNLCSILLAVDYLAAALVCAFVIDKFGRKSLMTVTSIASGFFNILLGSQLQFHWAPHWFTAFVIYAYSFVFNLGAAVVPFVLTAEVFLPEVRGICSSLSMVCMWVMNFVTLIIFNPLVDQLGLGPTFYFFSIICFIGGTYSHLWLPETKGLSADQIQPLFMKKKTRNT